MAARTLVDVRLESQDFPTENVHVRRLEGREAISQLFSFDLDVVVLHGELDEEEVIGATATVVFDRLVDREALPPTFATRSSAGSSPSLPRAGTRAEDPGDPDHDPAEEELAPDPLLFLSLRRLLSTRAATGDAPGTGDADGYAVLRGTTDRWASPLESAPAVADVAGGGAIARALRDARAERGSIPRTRLGWTLDGRPLHLEELFLEPPLHRATREQLVSGDLAWSDAATPVDVVPRDALPPLHPGLLDLFERAGVVREADRRSAEAAGAWPATRSVSADGASSSLVKLGDMEARGEGQRHVEGSCGAGGWACSHEAPTGSAVAHAGTDTVGAMPAEVDEAFPTQRCAHPSRESELRMLAHAMYRMMLSAAVLENLAAEADGRSAFDDSSWYRRQYDMLRWTLLSLPEWSRGMGLPWAARRGAAEAEGDVPETTAGLLARHSIRMEKPLRSGIRRVWEAPLETSFSRAAERALELGGATSLDADRARLALLRRPFVEAGVLEGRGRVVPVGETAPAMMFAPAETTRPGDFTVETFAAPRRVHGMIAEVVSLLDNVDEPYRAYRLRVVPRAHRLTLVEVQEIFLDQSIPEIITEKLRRVGLEPADYEMRLLEDYPRRPFVVQYRETDLAFVSRLAEHVGISFHFEHDEGIDKIVFSDRNTGFLPIEGDARVPFRSRGEQRDVYRIERTRRLVPSTYVLQEYNHRRPLLDLTVQHDLEGGDMGGYVEYAAHYATPEEGARLARVRGEERQNTQRTYEGQGEVHRFGAGGTFVLEDHPWVTEPELLLVEVIHRAAQPVMIHGDREGERTYTNTFRALDARATYRPPRRTPRPRIHGLVTGIVEPNADHSLTPYARIDDAGDYTVRFFFDLTPLGVRRRSSLPVRMLQGHAGTNYGIHFPLKPGIEVQVAFVDGDPDRPFIVGAVPNPITPSPVTRSNSIMNRIETASGVYLEIKDL